MAHDEPRDERAPRYHGQSTRADIVEREADQHRPQPAAGERRRDLGDDQTHVVLLGDFDDPLQVSAASIARLYAWNPAVVASDAPYAAVSSAAFFTSAGEAASKCGWLVRAKPTSLG
jgi:hypothetical protein